MQALQVVTSPVHSIATQPTPLHTAQSLGLAEHPWTSFFAQATLEVPQKVQLSGLPEHSDMLEVDDMR